MKTLENYGRLPVTEQNGKNNSISRDIKREREIFNEIM